MDDLDDGTLPRHGAPTPESDRDGAKASLYCATSHELASETGRYYDQGQRREPSVAADAGAGR